MFCNSKTLRSVSASFFVFFVLGLLFCDCSYAFSDKPPVFTRIEITEIQPPASYENARRYKISYFGKLGDSEIQVYPTYEQKKADSDLILARAVRAYLNDEYEAQGKALDEFCVEKSNLGEIVDLISGSFLSAAWKEENVNSFRQIIHKGQTRIELHTLNVYLDYEMQGCENYGLDINPIILDLGGEQTDTCTFILVNYSDK